jgi:hypothetical protein
MVPLRRPRLLLLATLVGCVTPAPAPPPVAQPPPGYTPPPGYAYPPQPYPAPYAQPAPQPVPGPAPAPLPAPQPLPAAPSNRPLLGALVGPQAWQAETRAVLDELKANLSPDKQQLVAGIPLTFDPDPGDVNAFAGCDDQGAPFIAGTEGLLEAIDAIAQTKATDELFGTRTYDAYTAAVTPGLVSSPGARAILPAGIIPAQYWSDPRRISRAHEIFDETVGFTFGHELSHHYLGHTGCAHGQPAGVPPVASDFNRFITSAIPTLNQWNEAAADQAGVNNLLDAGKARSATAYRWNEEGGLWLFDFFARLDGASGSTGIVSFTRTHPNPAIRIPVLQADAAGWRFLHPG